MSMCLSAIMPAAQDLCFVEIWEKQIGAVRVDGNTLQPIGEVHVDLVAGSDPEGLQELTHLLNGATPAGYDVADLATAVCDLLGRRFPETWDDSLIYDLAEAARMLWPGARYSTLAGWAEVNPVPDSALEQAQGYVAIAQRLRATFQAGQLYGDLPADERHIAHRLLERLVQGRKTYGPWRIDGRKRLAVEAMNEALDGMHYTAASLVALDRHVVDAQRGFGRRRIFVCTDERGPSDREQARLAADAIIEEGNVPVVSRADALLHVGRGCDADADVGRLALLEQCDELRVYGTTLTEHMRLQIEHAQRRGIPVKFTGRSGSA